MSPKNVTPKNFTKLMQEINDDFVVPINLDIISPMLTQPNVVAPLPTQLNANTPLPTQAYPMLGTNQCCLVIQFLNKTSNMNKKYYYFLKKRWICIFKIPHIFIYRQLCILFYFSLC
jgi:hypothetical protein